MWTAGPALIDLDTNWPTPIVSKIVEAFSKPGARVVLLPWPTPQPAPSRRRRLGVVGADGGIDHVPGAAPDRDTEAGVSDALAAVDGLDRNGRVVRIAAEENVPGPASRPFWADLVGEFDRAPTIASPPPRSDFDGTVFDESDTTSPDSVNSADLVITSLRPEHGGNHVSDLVALVAARLLRVNGILVVLTHSDWLQGELIDPTGAVVASAQNADLLYLQHIAALHVPVRSGRFATESLTDADDPAAEQQTRIRHRAAVRGLPAPHRRIHSDVLVFGQPHDYHESLAMGSAEQALESGVIR